MSSSILSSFCDINKKTAGAVVSACDEVESRLDDAVMDGSAMIYDDTSSSSSLSQRFIGKPGALFNGTNCPLDLNIISGQSTSTVLNRMFTNELNIASFCSEQNQP